MPADAPSDDIVIIGIDFGTTYSGVAWAYSKDPDEIELVTSWDAELNHCSDVEKAPTQLHYGNRGEPTTWGYSVPPEKDALKWFKLLLLDDKDIPDDVSASDQLREARRLQKVVNKDPTEIISCFLRHIWNHSIDSITRALGEELLKRCRFHVIITLPAIWPPYAQHRMKRAAKLSGILDWRVSGDTTLRFISEPEAAALATLKDLSKRSTMKAGDTIVVCDAGGGTVDLISYFVETVEPFVVKECVKGDGDLCGGVFLDENFVNLIKEKVTPASWEDVSQAEMKRFLNDVWEHGIKPQFQNQARTWTVDLPEGSHVAGQLNRQGRKMKRRQVIQLNSRELLNVFSPIIDKVVGLVRRQAEGVKEKYSDPPKYIILVGGFGRSRYLFDRLQSEFSPASTVLQSRGNKPWTAICRGAVVQGLTTRNLSRHIGVSIASRVSRRSYGVTYTTNWIEGVHRESDKYWCEEEQTYMAKNQMKWFLRKGDDLSDKNPVRESYYRLYSEPITCVYGAILQCSSFPPPTRRDATVEHLCYVIWTRDVSLGSLPTYINKLGKVYHQLYFDYEMTCEEGTVDFTIYHEDKRVGGRNVEVEFD